MQQASKNARVCKSVHLVEEMGAKMDTQQTMEIIVMMGIVVLAEEKGEYM
jgi:hypothetical protein